MREKVKNNLVDQEILRIEISRKGYWGEEIITVMPVEGGFEVYMWCKNWFHSTLADALAFVSEEFKYIELSPLED